MFPEVSGCLRTMRHHNPRDRTLHSDYRENLNTQLFNATYKQQKIVINIYNTLLLQHVTE
jgi:hypothetical protein